MAGEEAAKPKWYTRPHISSWYALSAVLVGIFAVNACGYPFATVPSVAERYYPDVAPAAIRWQPVTVAAVSTIAVIFVLPAIRRFGIHVVVYASASFLVLGGVFRCFAMASPVQDGSTHGVTSYAMVHFGTAVMAVALAPFQVAGTLVSTTFPRRNRVFVHTMVCSVTPLGLLVGALMPKAVGLEPLEAATTTKINALLLTYTMIAAAAFLAIVGLMCVATTALHHAAVEATMQELRERSSPSVMMNTRADRDSEEEGRSNERAQEHHVEVGEYDNTENVAATDVLPQIAKLASSAEFICVAVAFALSVSPLQLFFNFQELIVDSHGFFNTPADKIIVVVVAVAVFLLPALLHTVYRLRAVRRLDVIGLQLALLGIMIVCANFIVGGVTARDTGTHAMLAATAVLAAALMALLLERSISAAQRNRPAVAAGTVWLATHSLTVLYAGMSEGMRCPSEEGGLGKGHRSGVCTFDRVKWLAVCSFAAAFVAAVLSLLLSSRRGLSCPAPASLVQLQPARNHA